MQARIVRMFSERMGIPVSEGTEIFDKNGVISEFRLHNSETLSYKGYISADKDWLHCVVGHKSGTFNQLVRELALFDVIAGKIANDQ